MNDPIGIGVISFAHGHANVSAAEGRLVAFN